MEADAVRPVKRRRIEYYTPQDDQPVGSLDHTAAHAHEITQLAAISEVPRRRQGHIQEVHMRIRTHLTNEEMELDRRQLGVDLGVGVGETLPDPTIAGVAVPTVSLGVTAGVSAGVSVAVTGSVNLPGLTPTSDGTGKITSAPQPTGSSGTDPKSASLASSLLPSDANSTASIVPSGSSSGVRNSTISVTQAPLHSNSTDFYLATLDGTTYTVGRESHAYTTTFPNGQIAVITDAPSHKSSHTATPTSGSALFASSEGRNSASSSAAQNTGAGIATTSTSSGSSTTSTAAANNNNNDTPPAGVIAGGVVGGAAGVAVIILIAMIFLRWYRRRTQLGHHALPPNATPDLGGPSQPRSGPGMAERAGLTPLMGTVPAFFRHQNRNRAIDAPGEADTAERGFTRVSGRKLPSQFSGGMSSHPPPPPPPPMNNSDAEQNYTNTSFYRDSNGFYGGEGATAAAGDIDRHPSDASSTQAVHTGPTDPEYMTLSPGPQRRPTVSQGGPYVMRSPPHPAQQPTYHPPPQHDTEMGGFERITGAQQLPGPYDGYGPVSTDSPYNESRATFDRTGAPSPADHLDGGGSRGSRFTEQV